MGRKAQPVRMSPQTLRVLEAFLDDPTTEQSGADVQKRGAIASGTLYPILLRLEAAGWFVSCWEDIDPTEAGRLRRRLYRLTSTGLASANECSRPSVLAEQFPHQQPRTSFDGGCCAVRWCA